MHFNYKNILINHGFGDTNEYKNIYINLYNSLKRAISEHTLEEYEKLPPTRLLAKDIGVSRSTVIKAYELLALEKFVSSKQGSGYFVNPIRDKKLIHALSHQTKLGGYPKISKRGNSFRKNVLLFNKLKPVQGIAFRPGLPPLDIFPITQWKNLSNHYWKEVRSSQLSYANTIGTDALRENISNYLKMYRNIDCDPAQIIVTTGSLHSLSLIADALIDKKDEIVIENPTYPHAYHLFDSLKARMSYVNIDKEGMVISSAKCRSPKCVYTTPSNQYPTGIKMSINRRMELLKWASERNTFIVEDDYDHEFSNWERPVSSIFSLDKQERVIYLGTFNKLLHPSIRIGYMIVPHYLLDTVVALYEQSSRFVSPSLQNILSAFIEKDYLNKHLRHVIEVSLERKALFFECFNSNFNGDIRIDPDNTGLHIIGKLENGTEDIRLTNHLGEHGIVAHPYSNYFIGGEKQNGIVMGYSSVNNKMIRETIIKMKQAYNSLISQ